MGVQPPHARSRRQGDSGPSDSLDLILGYARQSYDQQVARFDTYRARSGSLLAFAAVLVTFSAGTTATTDHAPVQAAGTVSVLAAAVLFLIASSGPGLRLMPTVRWLTTAEVGDTASGTKARLLRSLLVTLESNQRVLTRLGTVLSIGLFWLLTGTIIIGVRVTLLLL